MCVCVFVCVCVCVCDIDSRVYIQNTCFTQYATNGDNHGHEEESRKTDNNQHLRSLMKYHVSV